MMLEASSRPTKRVLLIVCHPSMETSRVNQRLMMAARTLDVTVHDLYERYPEQMVNVQEEQSLLAAHDVVVFQHPLYWYSCPPLMKNWIDSVLTAGWAYGQGGQALKGKRWVHVISTGGNQSVYQRDGANNFTMAELLRPFEQTARLCGMIYCQPFMTPLNIVADTQLLEARIDAYQQWLSHMLVGVFPPEVSTLHGESVDYRPANHKGNA